MKCLKSTIHIGTPFFVEGEDYDLRPAEQVGRFKVYEYERGGNLYRFGLDENGELEMDGYFYKFEVM